MPQTFTGTLRGKTITLDTMASFGSSPAGATAQRVKVTVEPVGRSAEEAIPASLHKLVSQGKARQGERNRPGLYPTFEPALTEGTALELLDEERGER